MPRGVYEGNLLVKGHTPWNKIEDIFVSCETCSKIIQVAHNRKDKAKFCSHPCYAQSLKRGTHTQEHKEKIGKAQMGKRLGSKHKEETKKRMSLSGKRVAATPGGRANRSRGGILGSKACGEGRPTSIEVKLYQELKDRGILFEKQKIINGKFVVDAYIPSLNLIIEADGDYWHSLDRVMKKDKAENAYLTKCGFNLLRLSESEINDGTFRERMVIN